MGVRGSQERFGGGIGFIARRGEHAVECGGCSDDDGCACCHEDAGDAEVWLWSGVGFVGAETPGELVGGDEVGLNAKECERGDGGKQGGDGDDECNLCSWTRRGREPDARDVRCSRGGAALAQVSMTARRKSEAGTLPSPPRGDTKRGHRGGIERFATLNMGEARRSEGEGADLE